MAKAGLSFADPFMDKVGIGPAPNPYAPLSPTSGIGLGNLGQSAADIALVGERMARGTQFTLPEMRRPPDIGISETTGELFVQGRRFAADDAPAALQAEGLLGQPGSGQLPAGFTPLDQQAYQQYLQSIREPSLGRLASKSFGRGVDVSQALFGRGLQLAGAEELGGRIVAAQEEQLRRTSPFERQFTDIESGRDAVEWFVANFAQQGPNMIESVVTAGLGFLAGSAAGGPLAGVGGAFAGMMGKTAFKESVKAAAKKKAAGEALNAGEEKLLKEAAGLAGAVAASYTQNIATGASDLYGQLRESGADANDVDARIKALAGSLPYAALETLPEYLLASRLLAGVGAPAAIPAGTTIGRRGAELLRRGGVGFGVGGLAEGTTEAAQEALGIGITRQDLTSDESLNRLINSFAAGFGVGGPIGAVANLQGKAPANLLDPGQSTEPTGTDQRVADTKTQAPPRLPLVAAPGTQGDLFGGVGPVSELFPADQTGAQLEDRNALLNERRNLESFIATAQQELQDAASGRRALDPTRISTLTAQINSARTALNQINKYLSEPTLETVDLDIGAGTARVTEYANPLLNLPPVVTGGAPGQLGLFQPAPTGVQQILGQRAAEQQTQNILQGAMVPGLPLQAGIDERLGIGRVPPVAATMGLATQLPGGFPTVQQALTEAQQAQLRAQAFQQAEAQAQAQREADFQRMEAQAAAQRQLQLAQPAVAAAAPVEMPTAPVRQRQPQQLPLFGPRGLPRPSGAERLRRGATPLPEPSVTVPVTPRESLQVAGQLPLFTQEGAPSVAALRGAGKRRKVRPQLQRGGRQRPSEPAAKIRQVAEKIRKRQRVDSETSNGGRFVGIIDQEGNLISGKQTYADGTSFEGTFENGDTPKNGVYIDENGERLQVRNGNYVLQERGAEEVPTREPAKTGAGVGTEVPGERAAAGKGETLKKGEPRKAPPLRKAREEVTRPKAEAAVAAYATPDEAWEDMKPDDAPALSALSPVQQAEWIVLYENNRVSQAGAAEILKSRTKIVTGETGRVEQLTKKIRAEQRQATPEAKDQEEVDTLIETIETTKSKTAYRQAISSLLGWLYTADANAKRAGLDVKAYEFLNSMPVDDAYREAFVEFARITKSSAARDVEEGAKASGRIKARNAKDEYTPIFQLILRAQMLDPLRQKFGFDNLPEDMRLPDEGKPTDLPENKVLEEPKDTDVTEDWDAEDGAFFRDDNQPIRNPVVIGRVRMLVTRFVSKLSVKPRVRVFRNQADLKAKDPELYAQAVAARPQGDFDTVSAVGYSFGDRNVIIFSDRVRTDQQLNFVLAHESLGHVGFRALIPQDKFDALMNRIYNQSPAIQAGVDAAMQARGLPKAEAVEEYLADFAAELDSSIVSRIWNAIKGALNKLGIEFGDEAARYFVSLSRKYVRNGDVSSFFRAQDMIKDLQAIENGFDPNNVGRFAQTQTLRGDNIIAGLMQDNIEGRPMSVDDAVKYIKDKGVDLSGTWDNFTTKFFSLLAFRARKNPGFAELERVLSEGRDISMSIKVAMKEKMDQVLNRAITLPGTDYSVGGITPEQMDKVNEFLYAGQRYAVSKLDKTKLGSKPLYTVSKDGELVPDEAEITRLYDMGLLTFKQMRDGFSFQISYEEAGKTKTDTVKIDGIPGLTEDSIEWKGYLSVREAMRDVELKLLKARYLGYTQDRDLAYREIADLTKDQRVSGNARRFLDRMYNKYRDLWTDDRVIDADGNMQFNDKSIKSANDFLVALNQAIIGKDTDRNAAVAKFFEGKISEKEISDSIEEFKKELNITEENKFLVQNKLKDIIVAELSNEQADMYTKRTLATGYTPVLRRGEYEVRIAAFNKKGERVVLKQDYKDQLVYRQFENESEALTIADQMNKDLFGGRTYKVEARNRDGEFELMDVTLEAETSAALDAIAAPPQLNLNEFIRGLRQFSIVLRPDKLENVIVALTNQNNRARQRLERKFVPGYDPDAIRAVTEHVESRASTIAKVMMRPRISEIMNLRMKESRDLWFGSAEQLRLLEKNWKDAEANPQTTEAQKVYAKRLYDNYAYMYNETNPEGKAKRGNQFYNEASGLLQFIENNRDLNESDFGAGEVASRVRAYTSIFQLGGSIATGALNFIGAITNSIPFLATYNQQTALGGGFGFGPSFAAFQRALSNVGLRRAMADSRLNTAEFYEEMATNPQLLKQYGLEEHEAKFIAREIREGTMIPAQTNALVETARGRVQSGALQKTIDGFMWTFNATEQASRRGVGLAAYRLEYARRKAAGASDKNAAEFARAFAVEALKLSLGEYSVLNRPAAWRSGIQSFLYMYKVFPTTSIQLLKALPRSGKLYMLAAMWMLAGVSGFPFAEDLEDLIDTIAQKLGFRAGSIRFEIAKLIDSVAPGASQILLNGGANMVLPADLAGRVSLGDYVPGTGVLLAGANVGRELAEIGGPAVSMMFGEIGLVNSVATGIKAAATEKVTFEDWLRENPVTAARLLGDSLAYINSGAIVDRRGYIVDQDASASIILTRLLGFYPASAAEEYGVVRISKRVIDYQKEVSAGFRQAWVKAMIRGDMDQARAIVESVDDWNEGAAGTALEIKSFERNARKALREANRPAGERLLRGAPKAAQQELEQAAELLGY